MRRVIYIIIAVLLAIGIAVGAGVYYYFQGTPAYSLYRLRNAMSEGDRETFYFHFDTRKVVENAIAARLPHLGPGAPRQALVGVAETALRQKLEEKLGGQERAEFSGMQLQSVTREGSSARVALAGENRRLAIVLEQMPDRLWKIVEIDLESAGIEVPIPERQVDVRESTPEPAAAPPRLPLGPRRAR